MTLTLVVVSLNDQPLSQPITASFDARGGTIGRADHNTMALPDPERHVSRLQAEVVAQGAGYLIRNVGAANAIVVAGRSIAQGETAPISDTDQIRMGGYLLRAQFQPGLSDPPSTTGSVSVASSLVARSGPGTASLRAQPPTPPPPQPPQPVSQPLAQPPAQAPASAVDDGPFAGLFGPRTPMASDPFADLLAPSPGTRPAPPRASPALLPEDFDPFAPTRPPQRPSAPPPADAFADFMPQPGVGSASGDPVLDAFGAPGRDALADFVADLSAPVAAPGALRPQVSTDPMEALFGAGAAAPPPAGLPQRNDVSDLHAAFAPPLAVAPPVAPSSPPVGGSAVPGAAPGAAQRTLDAAGWWAAFCEGAGVRVPLQAGDDIQRAIASGHMLRSAVDGILKLMLIRASTKHEMRAAVTVIRSRENNPLKFSPDGRAGLEQLLQPPLRGFLDGPEAMDDAMRDLVGHAIGTVAGMRAAVDGMLDRFAPEALESKLLGASVLDHLLPMNRKARLWDLYCRHHRSIREEAQEDFQTLFGEAFRAAYEQQIERLRREGGAP